MTTDHHPSTESDLSVERDGVHLAGSLWTPADDPRAVVVMWPGSGPWDRDSDDDFPTIRDHYLSLGVAVCAFDKRGAGGSTGSWLTASVDVQAADALAAAEHATAELPHVPVGFAGHSQGGWVVLEAAARRPDAGFVISTSGPGVTPATQERHATLVRLAERAHDTVEFADALRCFELAVACLAARLTFDGFVGYVRRAGLTHVLERPDLFSIPLHDPVVWPYATVIFDHDPDRALRSLSMPTLAMFGSADPLVPVDASVAAFESRVPAELLTVSVLPDGDHLLQRDGEFVEGYFDTISTFIESSLAR